MKRMLAVCKNCGYEEKIEIYNREDAERQNLRLEPPRCKKYGSLNVKLRD